MAVYGHVATIRCEDLLTAFGLLLQPSGRTHGLDFLSGNNGCTSSVGIHAWLAAIV